MTGQEVKDMWKSATATALVSAVVTVALGAVLWYAAAEKRLAVIEERTASNRSAIEFVERDYVRRQDIVRIEAKIDALLLQRREGGR